MIPTRASGKSTLHGVCRVASPHPAVNFLPAHGVGNTTHAYALDVRIYTVTRLPSLCISVLVTHFTHCCQTIQCALQSSSFGYNMNGCAQSRAVLYDRIDTRCQPPPRTARPRTRVHKGKLGGVSETPPVAPPLTRPNAHTLLSLCPPPTRVLGIAWPAAIWPALQSAVQCRGSSYGLCIHVPYMCQLHRPSRSGTSMLQPVGWVGCVTTARNGGSLRVSHVPHTPPFRLLRFRTECGICNGRSH